MRKAKSGSNWFFVDESGDPTFYDRKGNLIVGLEGCSPILVLGFIETQNPEPIRKSLLQLQREAVADPYFEGVPSLARTAVALHAKDDLPEIRYQVFKLLAQLEFKAQFVVARKIEKVFRNNFHANEDRILRPPCLPALQEHIAPLRAEHHLLRQARLSQPPVAFQTAIRLGMTQFEQRWGTPVTTQVAIQAQTPAGEPCLSAVDYMNWAVYQAFTRGEMRYFRQVQDKVSLLVDLYDRPNYPKNWYNRKNQFDIKKITPLQLGPFTGRTA